MSQLLVIEWKVSLSQSWCLPVTSSCLYSWIMFYGENAFFCPSDVEFPERNLRWGALLLPSSLQTWQRLRGRRGRRWKKLRREKRQLTEQEASKLAHSDWLFVADGNFANWKAACDMNSLSDLSRVSAKLSSLSIVFSSFGTSTRLDRCFSW